jgi:hypothetical protein
MDPGDRRNEMTSQIRGAAIEVHSTLRPDRGLNDGIRRLVNDFTDPKRVSALSAVVLSNKEER